MPTCPRCATQVTGNARFCPGCGTSFTPMDGVGGMGQVNGVPMRIQQSGTQGGRPEFQPIIDELKRLYRTKVLPMEQAFKFDEFHSPSLTDVDFDAKPMVLLLGQYSTGKTTFIKYILERDFPGAHIGPEPTTDRFVAVMYGKDERIIPGNALAAAADKPFQALSKYGMAFLNKFEASLCQSPILEKVFFVDTPGVLSGEKQRIGRTYNFPEVIEWFAERADRILLLFDAHKLDISDEFKSAIESLRGQDDKIRVVLNKADMDIQHLLRCYGALMWSLGKVIKTPEVPRVYIGNFWDQPLRHPENAKLLALEQQDLLSDLRALPRNAAVRKINELVKRARMCKVHAYIINHLRNQFGMFGREKLQKKLLNNLAEEFRKVQGETNLPPGDFPNVPRFADSLNKYDISKFPKLDKLKLAAMDEVLAIDIPRLMKMIPSADESARNNISQAQRLEEANPFILPPDKQPISQGWVIAGSAKAKYDNEFYALDLNNENKVSGGNAKKVLLKTKLPTSLLRGVWELSDIDKDGMLDSDEFAVAMYICDQLNSQTWSELPKDLPAEVIPPSKRSLVQKTATIDG